jgi:hypothetical protein
MMKTMPIPKLTAKNPADRLVELYRKLGWDDKKTYVDPCKIRLTESDYQHLLREEEEHAKTVFPEIPDSDIVLGINMLWMNSGPSSYGKTPGMIEISEGWLDR